MFWNKPRGRPPDKNNAEWSTAITHPAHDRTKSPEAIPSRQLYHRTSPKCKSFLDKIQKFCNESCVGLVRKIAAHLKNLIRKYDPGAKVTASHPLFCELREKQREAIEERILLEYKSRLGHEVGEVPYKILYTATKGGKLCYDLQTDYNELKHDYHVVVFNENAPVQFNEGFQAINMTGGLARTEEFIATVPTWKRILQENLHDLINNYDFD